MSKPIDLSDHFAGSMLGLAIGDAFGAYFEGQDSDLLAKRFSTARHLIDNPPIMPWFYTDDTQMAIGVAQALLQDGAIIEETLCRAFVDNYVPSRGYGRGARLILEAMENGEDYRHWTNELFPGGSFGNGAAMRVAPIGLYYFDDVERAWEAARQQSLPTHVHPLGIEGAQLLAAAVAWVVAERSAKQQRDSQRDGPFPRELFFQDLLTHPVDDVYRQLLRRAAQIQCVSELSELGNGIAAQESVVTAIACFSLWPDDFQELVAHAVLLGGDTDTIAAMAGALAGARLGLAGLPNGWVLALEDDYQGRRYIEQLGRSLAEQRR